MGLLDWLQNNISQSLDTMQTQRNMRDGARQFLQANGATPLQAAWEAKDLGPLAAVAGGFGGITSPVGGPFRAFHSSPYNFEKFDLSKRLSGEGNNTFGSGIYAAESPAVSGRGGAYDAMFTSRNLGKHDLNMAEGAALKALGSNGSELDALRELASRGIPFDEAQSIVDRIGKAKSNIYELNINADKTHFLDWDSPLSRQSEYVQSALKNFGFQFDKSGMDKFDDALLDALHGDKNIPLPKQPPDPLGANIYESPKIIPGQYKNSPAASDALNSVGIPGIKYFDQVSRGAADGTRNFVLFDPSIIEIIRRYGIGGLLAGGGAAATMGGGDAQAQPAGLLDQ